MRWTIPAAGAVPVFRAYDLGCEFDATHVQQMYGADMRVRLRDDNAQPARDAAGQEIVFANSWEEAPTTTLTTSESSWLSRLDACTGRVEWTELRGDDQCRPPKGRWKKGGDNSCTWDANDGGPDQCNPRQAR